ncbi:PadR family transcriptional regulator [Vibrio cholerae]|uniref:PadR family transcriptional regulator n=1 Tax=Vibrio cholerae TaxID=666 RepID=UPI001E006393|nr:PadR family transcriptional regulator [Vibrio cholerae]EGR0792944.1 PadR family transcriptional regulator [Vibrio cholerae]EGR0805493.1 PadR family transcriptional regulator [Vibrio cholerae]EGR0810092.1 PadR family transcriptional regulator [Vibrio cholerae]EGR0873505.1 PadR family transcriptional regulator [Vibrio cholerae]EGR1122880.1 PadR family transcriptional regulator [Vibrio cholerae]
MSLSNLPLIIMAEISQKPLTGYDLSKLIFDKGWKASHQQIYRELAKLEANRFASCQYIPQVGKPDKKVYSLTPFGRAELVKSYDAEPSCTRVQDEALAHLFLANTSYFAKLSGKIQQELNELVDENASPTMKLDVVAQLARARRIGQLEAEAEWVDSVLKSLTIKGIVKAA